METVINSNQNKNQIRGRESSEFNTSLAVSNRLLPALSFQEELIILLNKHSVEKRSKTPDYIIAKYLINCLISFERAIEERGIWHNKSL